MKSSTFITSKRKMWSGRVITAFSLALFVVIVVIILLANKYLNYSMNKETEVRDNRVALQEMGENLADASDYLTSEVRLFAITGDITHLYNYWYEVYDAKTRDKIIDKFQTLDTPDEEKEKLNTAKFYSDDLINIETYSMKLRLLSLNITAEDYKGDEKLYGYIKNVLDYTIKDFSDIDKTQYTQLSIDLLFDETYSDYKSNIMVPITEFQEMMSKRLADDVKNSTEGMHTASAIQLAGSAVALILIGWLLLLMHILYIRPLKNYSAQLDIAKEDNEVELMTLVRVVPQGAYELNEFGRLFNRLSVILHNELEEHTKNELAMKAARDEADKANNAKSEFLARMSHELRTPLNAVIGYLYLLNKCELNDKEKSYCKKIEYSSESLLSLISDILDFSKIESGNMVLESIDFSLVDLINQVYAVMENQIVSKNIRFSLDIDGGIADYVRGDMQRLRQVLLNLLGNACKFTERGEIKLIMKGIKDDEKSTTVLFAVKDSGIGISEKNCSRIFSSFVQNDASITRKYGGTGLGLSISKMIVEQASGGKYTIDVKSKLGEGSQFSFCMDFEIGRKPVSDGELLYVDEIDEGKKVLLVDDNEINIAVEREIIQSFGVCADTASCGRDAVSMAEKTHYDIIFMDIRMPQMEGYEAARRIRRLEKCNDVPIIALTADVQSGVDEKVISSGMDGYLHKPMKPEQLYMTMKKYFDVKEKIEHFNSYTGYFNVEKCLYNLNGNDKMLCTLADKFLASHLKSCEYIRFHIESGNIANACRMLHDIIGISSNLCCDELCECAAKLKEEIKEYDFGRIDEYSRLWECTVNEIKAYKLSVETERIRTSSFDYKTAVKTLLDLSKEFDFSAEQFFTDNYIVFNGAGFDMKYSDRLFDIFQRLHEQEEFEGSGVGLALCSKIMKRHNGSISIKGEVDKGAVVTLSFPAYS